MRFKGADVRYVAAGSGPALVLIPGLGGQLAFWSGVLPKLSRNHTVLSFDHPGCGSSEPTGHPISAEFLAEQTIALLDHLDIQAASIVGHSFGGAIAQVLAVDYPDRIDRLVLSSTWARPDAYFRRGFEQRKDVLQALGRRAYARLQSLSVLTPEYMANNVELVSEHERRAVANSGSVDNIVSRIDALLAFDRASEVAELSLPVLVTGTSDDLVVPFHMSRALADIIGNATVIERRAGGHFWPQFEPKAFLATVLPFLDGKSGAPKRLRIAMIGCGAIGKYVLEALQNDPTCQVCAILVPEGKRDDYRAALETDAIIAESVAAIADLGIDLAIECGGHGALRAHGASFLQAGVPLSVLSVGALADPSLENELRSTSRDSGAELEILSGAVGGLDALAAARHAGLHELVLEMRKPPEAWKNTAAEMAVNLEDIDQPHVVFKGTARDVATVYPKNANVAAAFALAAFGLDDTSVTLIADPLVKSNQHRIKARGVFGSLDFSIANHTLPDNPKSSLLAALSLIQAVRRRAGHKSAISREK